MTQTISKFIQLKEVSNEHSMETQQIKKGKASSNNDFFLSLSFSNKGQKNEASLQDDIITKLISLLYHGMSYKWSKWRQILCQTFTSNFPNSFFWSLDTRALMQCKQAEGFSLLHCSTYVTSGLKSSNPTNAQKQKSENIIYFTLKIYC